MRGSSSSSVTSSRQGFDDSSNEWMIERMQKRLEPVKGMSVWRNPERVSWSNLRLHDEIANENAGKGGEIEDYEEVENEEMIDSDTEACRWAPKLRLNDPELFVEEEVDNDGNFGPQLTRDSSTFSAPTAKYDSSSQRLLKGEGDAMAAYVTQNKRIPRRGEVGLDSEDIDKFERMGFVMSGSRHRRMNAVRLRKENQVLTAEGERDLLQMKHEERLRQETKHVSELRDLLQRRLDSV